MNGLRLLGLVSCIFLFMPNLSSGECTALPKKNDLYIPLACTFDDIVGTWSPISRLIMEEGDIEFKEHEIVMLQAKRHIPITVVRKSHPIIIKRDGGYSSLEIEQSEPNRQTLCFNDYTKLKDAEARSPDVPSAYYCYGR